MLPATLVTKSVRAEDPVDIDPVQLRSAIADVLKTTSRADLFVEWPY
jgi:hypothetical protein